MHNKSHYDTLNVSRNAKPAAITEAYERLVQKCRDELRPNADPSRYLKAIGDAHAVLSDPDQRAAYDLWLQEQERAKNGPKLPASPIKTPPAANPRAKDPNQSTGNIPAPVAPESADAPGKFRLTAAALLVLGVAGLFWLYKGRNTPEPPVAVASDSADNAVIQPPAEPSRSEVKATEVAEIAIPDHDRVALENYLGSWHGGVDTSAKWQKLEIQKKSANSLVFQLDSKAPGKIGEVYGVAEFRNGYALFFNQEYGCSIVFSIKSGTLNVNTSGCQAYHGAGTGFDGDYVRADMVKNTGTPVVGANAKQIAPVKQPKPVTAPSTVSSAAPVNAPEAPAANSGKLYRFVATVKNAEGKTERIELVAVNEEAARAILRDFRGNPKVVRIRRAWF
ncbi:DnaJ domain-containing protein [Arenimonas sp. GDDSR-1]|uniref:J domain-containing protein n=1 Tax=Arenimonas sp. GDDSR-1 TaxID=2950125 RepID=UPI00262F2B6F|nr:DnaJ domain-containing protein [Arenimonas sp. GDDSR-1]